MIRDGKLSLSLHALGHMALRPELPMTSDEIARQNCTHAVVVRRVLGRLRQAGIVRSEKGHAGGWRLARPAEGISVATVYEALGQPFLLPGRLQAPTENCAIVAALRTTLDAGMAEAEAVMRRHFAATSVQDLADAMQAGTSAEISAFPAGKTPL
jgi:Rrf2 family protein